MDPPWAEPHHPFPKAPLLKWHCREECVVLPGEKPRGRPDRLAPACGGEGCVSSELAVSAVEMCICPCLHCVLECCETVTLCACATGHGPSLALGHTAFPPPRHTQIP